MLDHVKKQKNSHLDELIMTLSSLVLFMTSICLLIMNSSILMDEHCIGSCEAVSFFFLFYLPKLSLLGMVVELICKRLSSHNFNYHLSFQKRLSMRTLKHVLFREINYSFAEYAQCSVNDLRQKRRFFIFLLFHSLVSFA